MADPHFWWKLLALLTTGLVFELFFILDAMDDIRRSKKEAQMTEMWLDSQKNCYECKDYFSCHVMLGVEIKKCSIITDGIKKDQWGPI